MWCYVFLCHLLDKGLILKQVFINDTDCPLILKAFSLLPQCPLGTQVKYDWSNTVSQ